MAVNVQPNIPAALDDALFQALRGVVGSDLAFPSVDAAWEAFCSQMSLVTRVDADGLREVLELEVTP